MSTRPPVRATAFTLTASTVVSVLLFLGGLVATAAGIAEPARLLATAGVVVLLATPVLGLIVTAVELRPLQPRSAVLALVVLVVLAIATVVALLTR